MQPIARLRFRTPRSEICERADPCEDHDREREVLFSLEHRAHVRRGLEDGGTELLPIRDVEPGADRCNDSRSTRGETDGEVSAPPTRSEQHRGMHERGDGQPSGMAVDVLDDAQNLHRFGHYTPGRTLA